MLIKTRCTLVIRNCVKSDDMKFSGLFNMLSDSSHEIRQQADSALSEFLQEIKNSPVRFLLYLVFVLVGGVIVCNKEAHFG